MIDSRLRYSLCAGADIVLLIILFSSILQGCTAPEDKSAPEIIEVSDDSLERQVLRTFTKGLPVCEGQVVNCINEATSDSAWDVCYESYVFCKDFPSVHLFSGVENHDSLYAQIDSVYGPIANPDRAPAHFELYRSERSSTIRFGRVLVGDSAIQVTTEFAGDTSVIGYPQRHTLDPGEHLLILNVAPLRPGSYTFTVRGDERIIFEQKFTRE